MALIGKIRSNSWLMIIMIGLGLGGFIIMDMFNSQKGIFGQGSQFSMGEVDGTEINYNKFNQMEQVLYGNQAGEVYGRRDYLWNYMVEEKLVEKSANQLGLGVSRDELRDLQFGNNPSPVIQQRFRDPNTGQLDREQLNGIQRSLDNGELGKSQIGQFWAVQESEIIKDRLQTKINNLVSKAMFIPSFVLEQNHKNQNNKVDFAYVQVPFDEVNDLDVEVSDNDLQTYLNAHQSEYISDVETRILTYTTFNVVPTASDSAKIRQDLTDLVNEFTTTDNDTVFVENNYGTFDGAFSKRSAINPDIADQLFTGDLGTVIGPYKENNTYKLAKVLDRKIIPDSVKSRHILIRATNPQEAVAARNRVDSLKNLIETGVASFDSLALRFGSDGTASQGGDLGYAAPNNMVKPFNDLIFFQAEEGKLYSVVTNFGVHLVEVTGKKFINNDEGVKVAYLTRTIVPSEETQKAYNEKALEFVAANRTIEELKKSVEADPNLTLETSAPLKKNDFLVGTLAPGEESRNMVRWTFSSDAANGEVAPSVYIFQDPVEYYESKFVVAGLQSTQDAGSVSLQNVRDIITPLVKKQKKGQQLIAQITSQDLASVAGKYSTQVDTARGIAFSTPNAAGLGNEPDVIAGVFKLQQGAVSKPIIGENGVYLTKLITKTEIPTPTNLVSLRKVQSQSIKSQVPGYLMEAIKKEAEVADFRSKFY